jgi:hypothetical protein
MTFLVLDIANLKRKFFSLFKAGLEGATNFSGVFSFPQALGGRGFAVTDNLTP